MDDSTVAAVMSTPIRRVARAGLRARAASALALGLLSAACAARTGIACPPPWPPPEAPVEEVLPDDGTLLAVLAARIRSDWNDSAPAARRAHSEQEWDEARAGLAGRADQITYSAGGERIGGFLVRPPVLGGRRMPVVIVNRAGLGDEGLDPDALLVELDRWSREGYVAVASAYRGNRLSRGEDAEGDATAIRALLPLVAQLAYADADRVFLLGYGGGALRTLNLLDELGAGSPVRAAAVVELAPGGRERNFATEVPLLVVGASFVGGVDASSSDEALIELTEGARAAGGEVEWFRADAEDAGLAPHEEAARARKRIAEWFAAHGGRTYLN